MNTLLISIEIVEFLMEILSFSVKLWSNLIFKAHFASLLGSASTMKDTTGHAINSPCT
jgi:F0F1-type ATP synthase membrane subunit a